MSMADELMATFESRLKKVFLECASVAALKAIKYHIALTPWNDWPEKLSNEQGAKILGLSIEEFTEKVKSGVFHPCQEGEEKDQLFDKQSLKNYFFGNP